MSKKHIDLNWVEVAELIDSFPFDGAHAFFSVLDLRNLKWTPTAEMTIFGPKYATAVGFQVSSTEKSSATFGNIKVDNLEGTLEADIIRHDGKLCFILRGKVRPSALPFVQELAEEARQRVKTHSIYRGKAIKIKTDRRGEVSASLAPEFLDVSGANASQLYFRDDVKAQIQSSIFTQIEKTELCRKSGLSLKRGILLAGSYGTGKTLTSVITAKKCQENGWTYLMVDRVSGLKDALFAAKQYAPAVVFAEDIDREMSGDTRTARIDDVLNTIDGVEFKNVEIVTILTTNDVSGINKAMMRPGRVDAVIFTHAPDAKAASEIARYYSGDMLDANTNMEMVGEALSGIIPAVIREVIDRAKLIAIAEATTEAPRLTYENLMLSLSSMKTHLDLMRAVKVDSTSAEKLESTLRTVITGALKDYLRQPVTDDEENLE